MQAYTVDLHAPPVEVEPVVRCELGRPDPEDRFDAIDNASAGTQLGDGDIKRGGFRTPEVRGRHLYLGFRDSLAARRNLQSFRIPCERRKIRPVTGNSCQHRDVCGGGGLVNNAGGEPHGCGLRRNAGRGDELPAAGDVHRRCRPQPDVAVDPAAGIPARGIRRVVEAHGQHIVAAELDVGGEVEFERRVAIRPAAEEVAVQPDLRIRHRPVELDKNPPARVGRRNREMLAIPPHPPPRELAAFAGIFLRERFLDSPVMRHVERPPRRVVECRRARVPGGIALRELPTHVEKDTLAWLTGNGTGAGGHGKRAMSDDCVQRTPPTPGSGRSCRSPHVPAITDATAQRAVPPCFRAERVLLGGMVKR